MLKVVAELADGWNFTGSTEEHKRKLRVLEKHCSRIGRRAEHIHRSWHGGCFITRDRGKIAKLMTEESSVHKYVKRIHVSIIGTPKQCADEIEKYVDLGVRYFMFSLPFAHFYTESLKSLQL